MADKEKLTRVVTYLDQKSIDALELWAKDFTWIDSQSRSVAVALWIFLGIGHGLHSLPGYGTAWGNSRNPFAEKASKTHNVKVNGGGQVLKLLPGKQADSSDPPKPIAG